MIARRKMILIANQFFKAYIILSSGSTGSFLAWPGENVINWSYTGHQSAPDHVWCLGLSWLGFARTLAHRMQPLRLAIQQARSAKTMSIHVTRGKPLDFDKTSVPWVAHIAVKWPCWACLSKSLLRLVDSASLDKSAHICPGMHLWHMHTCVWFMWLCLILFVLSFLQINTCRPMSFAKLCCVTMRLFGKLFSTGEA